MRVSAITVPIARSAAIIASRRPRETRPWPVGSISTVQTRKPAKTKLACSRSCTAWWVAAIVVEGRDVPGTERGGPDRERDAWPDEPGRSSPGPRGVPERREHGSRDREEKQRPAQRDEDQRRPGVGDQHVLEHVGREQVAVCELVERRDERDDDQREPDREEDGPRPRGVVLAPTAAQTDEAAGEAKSGNRGERRDDRLEQPRLEEAGRVHVRSIVKGSYRFRRDFRGSVASRRDEKGGNQMRGRRTPFVAGASALALLAGSGAAIAATHSAHTTRSRRSNTRRTKAPRPPRRHRQPGLGLERPPMPRGRNAPARAPAPGSSSTAGF